MSILTWKEDFLTNFEKNQLREQLKRRIRHANILLEHNISHLQVLHEILAITSKNNETVQEELTNSTFSDLLSDEAEKYGLEKRKQKKKTKKAERRNQKVLQSIRDTKREKLAFEKKIERELLMIDQRIRMCCKMEKRIKYAKMIEKKKSEWNKSKFSSMKKIGLSRNIRSTEDLKLKSYEVLPSTLC